MRPTYCKGDTKKDAQRKKHKEEEIPREKEGNSRERGRNTHMHRVIRRGDPEHDWERCILRTTLRERNTNKERHRHREGDTELREGGTDTHVEAHTQKKRCVCRYTQKETHTPRCTEEDTRD